MAWCELTGAIIRPDEVTILRQMDASYRSAVSIEMQDAMARQQSKTGK